jgi:hypothetical protein
MTRTDLSLETALGALAAETGAFSLVSLSPPAQHQTHPAWPPVFVAVLAPRAGGEPVTLAVEVRSRIYPAEALPLAETMAAARGAGTPVLYAPAVSPRVAEICADRNVGFLDAAGNCRIPAPGFYLQVSGKKNVHTDTRPAADVFAPFSSRIIRVLLTAPRRGWQVQELAREARVSLGLSSKVKQTLVREAFAVEAGRGRACALTVPQPGRLLEEWARHYKSLEVKEIQVRLGIDRARVEPFFLETCRAHRVGYALTGAPAAALVLGVEGPEGLTAYVTDKINQVADHLRPVASHGNRVTLRAAYDDSVFWGARDIDRRKVVSPLQLYLDLVGESGESDATAEAVLRQEIEPIWRGA